MCSGGLSAISICRTFDSHRNVVTWALVETYATGEQHVVTVGSNTMDPYLADSILAALRDMQMDLEGHVVNADDVSEE
jgi:hypothetical protein